MPDVPSTVATTAAAAEILDIRVHGVSNTPPAEMLETTPENVRRVDGDALGSFWARTDDAPKDGIHATEAFSWGAQARTGGGALAAIGRALVHVGWFLLLPYALVNLAYWTREIEPQASGSTRAWDGGTGAATVRVFGLLLTLIAVAAFGSVAIDLVAVQCYRGSEANAGQVCAALPSVFDGLRVLDVDSRAALLGLVPIAIILVLYSIGRRGRVRFEARIERFGEQIGGQQEPGLPLLATRGFWASARIRETSEWLHVAAAILLVLFLLAFDAAFPRANCVGAPTTADITTCLGPVDPLPMWFAVGAGAGILAVVVGVVLASHTPPRDAAPARGSLMRMVQQARQQPPDTRNTWKRVYAVGCLLTSAAGYLAWTVLTFTGATDASKVAPQFTGLITTPLVLMALALFLALSALGWRRRSTRRRVVSAVILAAAAATLLGSHLLADATARWLLTGVAVALVAVHLLLARMPSRPRAAADAAVADPFAASSAGALRYRAWRGQGAAVAMVLALFVSMALSSLLVLGAASWLGAPVAVSTERIWRTPGEPLSTAEWNVPDAYERFAVLLTVVTALTLIVLVAAAIVILPKLVKLTLPMLRWSSEQHSVGERSWEERGGVEKPGAGYPQPLTKPAERTRIRAVSRRYAQLLHRGEPLFAWIAVFAGAGFLALSSSVVFDGAKSVLAEWAPGLPAGIRLISTSILVGLAVVAVVAVVANAASSGERPLGVFWDVVAFFPRAGHPFAPPCFAERAVPELAEHTRAFLGATDTSTGPVTRRRAVLITAHSMGSTLSAATIMALRGETVDEGPLRGVLLTDRIALLSYGSQLRGYFSRFFPSVFGHRVLGVPGLLAPSLWRADPWADQVVDEFDLESLPAPSPITEGTLTGMLGARPRVAPRWRNLWRRTDYLGFPVFAYPDEGNPIDRGASETAVGYMWKIATHSDYLGVDQLHLARGELVEALAAEDDAHG